MSLFKKIPVSKSTAAHRELLAVRDKLMLEQRKAKGSKGGHRVKSILTPPDYYTKD
jgi:hypothetical protein